MVSLKIILIPIVGLLGLAAAGSAIAADNKIKKCQDVTGKWHYGTTAARECTQSKVIELDQSGNQRKVIAAPPTEAELKQREANKEERERLAKETEHNARHDEILLATYGHEDDITYIRDRKLGQLESSIKATEDTISPLRKALARFQAQAADEEKRGKGVSEHTAQGIAQSEAQIAKHEAVIAKKRQEQGTLRAQYEADYKRYLELKGKQRAGATPPKK